MEMKPYFTGRKATPIVGLAFTGVGACSEDFSAGRAVTEVGSRNRRRVGGMRDDTTVVTRLSKGTQIASLLVRKPTTRHYVSTVPLNRAVGKTIDRHTFGSSHIIIMLLLM